jgi:hypothetical protein
MSANGLSADTSNARPPTGLGLGARVTPTEPEQPQKSGLQHTLHWAAMLTCVVGCVVLCYADYTLDAGARQLAYPPLVAAGLFWLGELALGSLVATAGRELAAVPLVALTAFGLVHFHLLFALRWPASEGAFDAALADLKQHPEKAQDFHRKLGMWEIDLVQGDPGSDTVYFEVAGDEPDRPVFAHTLDGQSADWGSYHDCRRIDRGWQRCVWRF